MDAPFPWNTGGRNDPPLPPSRSAFAAEADDHLLRARDFVPTFQHDFFRPRAAGVLQPLPPLAPEQEAAVEYLVKRLRAGADHVSLAGAAGTGKTTVMRALDKELRRERRFVEVERWEKGGGGRETVLLDSVTLAAPTHKAKRRLAEAVGRTASTLHSLTYGGAEEIDALEEARRNTMALLEAGAIQPDELGNVVPLAPPKKGRLAGNKLVFKRRDDEAPTGDVVIVDEASMVNQTVRADFEDALRAGVQTVAVGDHCQLPPVEGVPGYDLANADALLTRVHRQAADNPILACATAIREQRCDLTPLLCSKYGIRFDYAKNKDVADMYTLSPDAVTIVGTNRTRCALNTTIREALGFAPMGAGPQPGEKVVALATGGGLTNGDEAVVLWQAPGPRIPGADQEWPLLWVYLALPGNVRTAALVSLDGWADPDPQVSGRTPKGLYAALTAMAGTGGAGSYTAAEEAKRIRELLVALAPGYAITTHKSQGSTHRQGLVVLEWTPGDKSDTWRSRYTALTRFSHRVICVSMKTSRW